MCPPTVKRRPERPPRRHVCSAQRVQRSVNVQTSTDCCLVSANSRRHYHYELLHSFRTNRGSNSSSAARYEPIGRDGSASRGRRRSASCLQSRSFHARSLETFV